MSNFTPIGVRRAVAPAGGLACRLLYTCIAAARRAAPTNERNRKSNVQTSDATYAALPADGRLNLNSEQLKSLRRKEGMSQEALSDACINRGLGLSLASVKRAESGKAVLYRTARHLAAFFGVSLEALTGTCNGPPAERSASCQHAYERNQIRLALRAVQESGCGRLTLLTGAEGTGKSPLLAAAARDARQCGYSCIALQAGAEGAPITRALASALLEIELTSAGHDTLPDAIGTGLRRLGLPASYLAPCMAAIAGPLPLGLFYSQTEQLIALCALIRHAAQDRPLFISVDDVHRSTPSRLALLEQLLQWTLNCPVSWVLAWNTGETAYLANGALLAALPRMVLHLDPVHAQNGPTDRSFPTSRSCAAALYGKGMPRRSDHCRQYRAES